jgi:hypothetical protein
MQQSAQMGGGWLMVDIYSTSFQQAYGKLTLMKLHTKKVWEKS